MRARARAWARISYDSHDYTRFAVAASCHYANCERAGELGIPGRIISSSYGLACHRHATRGYRRISNRETSFGLADGVGTGPIAGDIMPGDFNFTLVIDPPREARVGARHDRASHGIKSLSLVSGIRNTWVRARALPRVTRRYVIPLVPARRSDAFSFFFFNRFEINFSPGERCS